MQEKNGKNTGLRNSFSKDVKETQKQRNAPKSCKVTIQPLNVNGYIKKDSYIFNNLGGGEFDHH